MRVSWRARALADVESLTDYVALHRPASADRLSDAIDACVAMIREQPYIGRPGRTDMTREVVVPRLPYIVQYRVNETRSLISILRVLHGARRWPAAEA